MRKSSNGRIYLTYKGPKRHGRFKTRQEISVATRDEKSLMQILSFLGFKEGASIAKKREIWEKGRLTVYLDYVQGLGNFVEVEFVGSAQVAGEAAINRAIHNLGLDAHKALKESYLELMLKQLPKPSVQRQSG